MNLIRPLRIVVALLTLAALAGANVAIGQTPAAGTVTLTATPSSGKASVPVTLTWSTTPAAISCQAGGGSNGGAQGWSGTLPAFGSYTVPVSLITSQTYTVTCTWVDSAAVMSWTAPTQNSDGSALTDLTSYNIYEGPASPPGKIVASPAASAGTSYTFSGLPAGTNYFAVTAVNSKQQESALSNIVSKTTDATASASATVTVTVLPNPPGALTVK